MAGIPDSLRTGYGRRPYANGYSDSDSSLPYERSDDDRPYGGGQQRGARPSFQSRTNRRAGGYGAADYYRYPSSQEQEAEEAPKVARPTSLERTQAKRRSGGSPWGQRSPTRKGGYGDGSRQIEVVLAQIRRDWDFMTNDKCIPVQVALQLMDSSSLGLAGRHQQFQQIHQQLQNALRAIVNEHHQGFNSSIGTFHSIQAAIHTSQSKLRGLRESLVQAKSSLATTKPELKGLCTSSSNYDDMLQVLSAIEHLQSIPERLEARISEKRFLGAVELLQEALRSMRKSEMDNIGALSDLRVYLSNQEHSLTDILIEELHNHLYLKSPYCENRWKQYASQATKGIQSGEAPKAAVIGGRDLYRFLNQLDTSQPFQDDLTRNPEADTFAYIQLLVESLNSLGRLEVAVDTITHRLPVELFRVVEKSNTEVDQRHPSSVRGVKSPRDQFDISRNGRKAVLDDLLGSLYARFEAIAEGHRVVHEVITGILKREGGRASPALTGGFRELWKLYQSEVRSLLHDYLATEGDLSYGGGQEKSTNVFSRRQRDKTKKMFKLSDMDKKSSDISSEREDLEYILKASVPGLVSDSKRPDAAHQTNGINGHDGGATGHKLLVDASVFNMGILLPPSLAFLNRLREVVPPTSDIVMSTLTSFLDDFLLNVFLPQLEETLVELCAQTFIEADAFHQDAHWQRHARRPVFKGATKFVELVTAFCRLLDNLPHDQAFSQLVITQMVTYYDKCYGWYKSILIRARPHSLTGSRVKIAAALTEEGAVHDIVSQLATAEGETSKLLEQERDLLIRTFDEVQLEEMDIISDARKISSLCLLHTSMKWLATRLSTLRHISPRTTDSTASRRDSIRAPISRRWTLITGADPTPTSSAYLPLTAETATQFDGVVSSYAQLGAAVLRILHVELRAQTHLYVSRALSRPFVLDAAIADPDPDVLALNAAVASADEELGVHVDAAAHAFVMRGLATFMDDAVVHGLAAGTVQAMNAHGAGRLQLDILVLQQGVKSVEVEGAAELGRAALYAELFLKGPAAVVQQAREQAKRKEGEATAEVAKGKDRLTFSFAELKALIELCYSENLASERRELAVQAKRGLDDHVLQLSEYLW